MKPKQRYTYTVLRYVHDVVTGEFVNIGVLFYAPDSSFVRLLLRTSVGRIKSIFPDLNRAAFIESVHAVERTLKPLAKRITEGDLLSRFDDAGHVARAVLAADDSSLQWSPLSGGITDDPERTLDRIYSRHVSRYDARSPHRRSDDEVWRPVRALLEDRALEVEFNEKIVSGRADEIVFKRAWKNGTWHAYEPLSFDLADTDGIKDKARRWRGHLEAVHDGASADVKLHFIVGKPQNKMLYSAYRSAIQILKESAFEPDIYEETEIGVLVDKIEDELREHLARTQSNSDD